MLIHNNLKISKILQNVGNLNYVMKLRDNTDFKKAEYSNIGTKV